jgi:hypothetical protein
MVLRRIDTFFRLMDKALISPIYAVVASIRLIRDINAVLENPALNPSWRRLRGFAFSQASAAQKLLLSPVLPGGRSR